MAKVNMQKFFRKAYLSTPNYKTRKKKSPTRMMVIGFKWEKQ
jgi:hypothetical protein